MSHTNNTTMTQGDTGPLQQGTVKTIAEVSTIMLSALVRVLISSGPN